MTSMSEEDFDQETVLHDLTIFSQKLLGKFHVFEDGDKIEVTQLKRRDNGVWVTYHVHQGPGIPRKLVMMLDEFLQTYGHLFGVDE